MYLGNRAEEFGTFFNKFYQALVDYDEALTDYRASTITAYNRRLDSLNITPPISSTAKEKLDKVLARCSKIIQYNKSTRFLDDAVLLIGKSYFFMGEYLQAERKFSEFLSKLTKSNLYDEAILYLGKTKIKLGKNTDAEVILSNLFKTTLDNEIKSEITQDLAVLSISKNDYKGAIDNFVKSIEFTKDKEKKAEKQYILAKVYSQFKPEDAYLEYRKSYDLTSDFDLMFYSKLNEAKSFNEIGKTNDAFEILDRLNGKYRDYPELKQLVELEIANTYYYQKKYHEARTKYFDVIIEYAGTKSSADAYYHLAYYAENVKNNYLNAYINYKKVTETNSASDYSGISTKRTNVLDKYFSLRAVINDTTKITFPDNEPDFIIYKEKKEKEKGIDKKDIEYKGNEIPPEGPKGGGYGYYINLDTLFDVEGNILVDSNKILKKEIKDTSEINISGDTLTKKTEIEVKKLSPEDSLLLAIHVEDSIKAEKDLIKIDAYFQIAELFLYDLNREDSALYYLNLIIADSLHPERTAKALYSVATIYKNRNEESKSIEIYQRIILQYPGTIFANESRKILGIQMLDILVDSAEVLYKSAEKKIVKNEYGSALLDLQKILLNYPADSFYVKSLYSVGWIYEYVYMNKDSSLAYYNRLKKDFPNSQYTLSVNPKLEFYYSYDNKDTTKMSLDSTGILPDSSGVIIDSLNVKNNINIQPPNPEKNKNEGENIENGAPIIKPKEEEIK
jgi:tetratricopeptide (TPR) repeat protein